MTDRLTYIETERQKNRQTDLTDIHTEKHRDTEND